MQSQTPTVFSVTEFLGCVNITLTDFGLVKIQGEIDDISIRGSYAFFNLKESLGGIKAESALSCFVGWRCLPEIQSLLQSGTQVVISGYPSIYTKNGSFRVDVQTVQPVGVGALERAFAALKLKLESQGYFVQERKRAIPAFVKNIGLITSLSGAAVVDFQRNLGSHGFNIECIDVRVEGESAESSISAAIKKFNKQKRNFDVLILIRGGGSLESLVAFNSEQVADAIFSSRIPVMTGIGHEKDDTIADFVADLRCSTPTAVATYLRLQREETLRELQTRENELVYAFAENINSARLILSDVKMAITQEFSTIFLHTDSRVETLGYRLHLGWQRVFQNFHLLQQRFVRTLAEFDFRIKFLQQRQKSSQDRIVIWMQKFFEKRYSAVQNYERQLSSLNPESILERGYGIVFTEKGKLLKKSKDTKVGGMVRIQLHEGTLWSKVEKKQ